MIVLSAVASVGVTVVSKSLAVEPSKTRFPVMTPLPSKGSFEASVEVSDAQLKTPLPLVFKNWLAEPSAAGRVQTRLLATVPGDLNPT